MKDLLANFEDTIKKFDGEIIIFLDYDGTLVPIADKPELAIISNDMQTQLLSLTKHFKVAIISGRSLAELKKFVGIKKCYYVGNHGLEIQGPGIRIVQPEAKRTRPIMKKISRELRAKLRGIEGIIVEDKELTLSIHYRLVKRGEINNLKNTFLNAIDPYLRTGRIRITRGKKVIELRPNVDWGKGDAVLWLVDYLDPEIKLKPIYLGDDKTDENAFQALKARGITVLVSEKKKPSWARFYLRNVSEVKTFLKRLIMTTKSHVESFPKY